MCKPINILTFIRSRRGRKQIQQSQENRWQNKFTNVMESTEKTKMVGILRCMEGVHVHDQNDSTTQATNQSHLKSSPFQWGHFQLNQRGVPSTKCHSSYNFARRFSARWRPSGPDMKQRQKKTHIEQNMVVINLDTSTKNI